MRTFQFIFTLKRAILILTAAAATLMWSNLWAEPPDLADSCAECHGEGGQSDDPEIPIIAGPSAFYLENQLLLFQQKNRPCVSEQFDSDAPAESHCALVADLSEDEIIELAAYFSEQPFKPAPQETDQKLAEQGKAIHERKCDRCHAEAGSLALDDAGILAGQWRPYLVRTLTSFRDTDRWQPEKMEEEVDELSDQDINALAEFYASQGR